MNKSKIGIIGDLHFREYLRYAEYTADRRETERQSVLDTIVSSFSDCNRVVFMGDNFDVKNNPFYVVRAFTEFVERFNDKEVFIIAGNHEKTADGRTSIDYLKEIKGRNWHIITNTVEAIDGMVFCPYFYKEELGVKTPEEATVKLLEMLPNADIFFGHHAISDTNTVSGQSTNLFPEIVLPQSLMESKYRLVVGGHIHKPGQYGRTLVTGCTMSNEVGDIEKFAWKVERVVEFQKTSLPPIDVVDYKVERIPLPIRPIMKVENPTLEQLNSLLTHSKGSIIKAIFTDKAFAPSDELRAKLHEFDAFIILEQYPYERKKLDIQEGAMLDFTVEQLLGIYAKERKVAENKLLSAWELIK